MKIGLYFGSFNPIHHGHLIIASHVVQETDLQYSLIYLPEPFKINTRFNEYHRLRLVKLAIEDEKDFKASDIEFRLPKPSYSVTTLQYLEEKYPEHQFAIIMGSDSLQNLDKWKNAEVIMNRYPIYVYKRAEFEVREDLPIRKTILDAPSANFVARMREQLKR
jgi:nicotinate-nucleotide adenylyltransferase